MSGYPHIPHYTAHLFSSAEQHKHLVFIFVYNEGDKLREQLSRFPPADACGFDIMIGDDGSTDHSLDPQMLKQFGVRGLIRLDRHAGLSANIRAGLHWLLTHSCYDSIIMMNGNNKDDPEAIPRFINKMESGCDYVQGSRFLPGGSMQNTPALRHLAIRLIHSPLFSLAARHWMSDTTNGYRAFSRKFLTSPEVFPFQANFIHYEIEQYLAWKALRLKLPSCEIGVSRDYPARAQYKKGKKGTSISKIKPGYGYYLMLKPLLAILFKWYR